jgi:hypothetical protein
MVPTETPASRAAFALLCGLCLILARSSFAAVVGPVPRLVCADPVCDFGARDNEHEVEHSFVLKNAGDAPLKIDRVQACCGASAQLSENVIPPGSNATLQVTLSLQGRSGPVQKSIYVESDDPGNRIFQLRFVGNAIAVVDVQPGTVDFGAIDEDAEAERTVNVVCQSNVQFRVTNIVTTATNFSVLYAGVEGNTHRIAVRTSPPLPFGLLGGEVTLMTDHQKYSRLAVHVSAHVTSDIVFVPTEILLTGSKDKPEPVTRYVALRSRSATPFRILRLVPPPSAGAMVSYVPLEGGGYRLELKDILPNEDLNGEKLVVITDHKTARLIAVPFRVVPSAGLQK